MPGIELCQYVKAQAASLGFDRCGIAAATPIGRAAYLRAWLQSGQAGSMEYLHRYFKQRVDPRTLLKGAKSVIVVALLYHQSRPASPQQDRRRRGRVAMYAWGDDYHRVMKAKLYTMVDRMRDELADPFEAKVCVDTAPLLERELAAAAGIGWIGKNTMVLHSRLGSYFFLGVIVTTLELTPDEPLPDRCGTCTACLDACPTQAFPSAYKMDASRCISYLTIEHRGNISKAYQRLMGDWVFGCDVCQEVCPYNRDAPTTDEPRFATRRPGPEPILSDILGWSLDDYREQLRGSAMKRAKLPMLQRNARIAGENLERTRQGPAEPTGGDHRVDGLRDTLYISPGNLPARSPLEHGSAVTMSGSETTIKVINDGGVLTITLNRPEVLNAFTTDMLKALDHALRAAQKDKTVRCLVITGAGRAFSSGQDLAEVADRYKGDEPLELGSHLRAYYNPIISRLRTLEKPVIASVNGVAAGAGCSLALACDMRIAAESAGFIEAFIHVGLVPDSGSTFMLPRLIGVSRAMEMACTGRKVKAEEALRIGLVNRVVPDDQLEAETKTFAERLAGLPTRAVGLTKRAINASWSADLETQLDYEAMLQTTAGQTHDHREGVAAFLEKRTPKFTGE